jgi:hypothetical protein
VIPAANPPHAPADPRAPARTASYLVLTSAQYQVER